MLDEYRSHRPEANEEEKAWMATDSFAIVGRIVLVTAVAVMIGVTGSQLVGSDRPSEVAAANTAVTPR